MMTAVKGQRRGVTAPIDWANCGTEANYRRHLRLKEKPCEPCTRAARQIANERRARRNG